MMYVYVPGSFIIKIQLQAFPDTVQQQWFKPIRQTNAHHFMMALPLQPLTSNNSRIYSWSVF